MIKFSYDPKANACYVGLSSRQVRFLHEHRETETIYDGKGVMVNLDWATDGSLEGVEILLPPKAEEK